MKQITMDYDTYVFEVAAARKAGFNRLPDLVDKLKKILKDLDNYDEKNLYKSRNEILQILIDLERM